MKINKCVVCNKIKKIKAKNICNTCYRKQFPRKKDICKGCQKFKEIHAKSLCFICYNKQLLRRIIICKKCKKKKPIYAKNLCKTCYIIIYKKNNKSPLIKCKKCKRVRNHVGKNLCNTCYNKQLLREIIICEKCRKKKPIHALGFIDSIFTLTGAAIELYLFIYRVLGIGPIAGRPMLLLGAMLLVIGIQMISIGLLGEMIIFTHARELKEYNIEEIIETKE